MRRLLPLLLLLPVLAGASPVTERCTTAYTDGRYEEAARCFEDLEGMGNVTGDLLYDQGNAWYRAGDVGRAILAWRRAELLIPRDGDLAANLQAARDKVRDDLPLPDTRSALGRTLLGPVDRLAAGELLLLGAVSWAVFFGLLALWLRRRQGAPALAASGLVAVLALLGWGLSTWEQRTAPVGVVLADSISVRSGRDLQSRDLAVLHAGAEVTVVEAGDRWVQIAVPEGPRGWVPAESLGIAQL